MGDLVLDVTGNRAAMDNSLKVLRKQGTLIYAGRAGKEREARATQTAVARAAAVEPPAPTPAAAMTPMTRRWPSSRMAHPAAEIGEGLPDNGHKFPIVTILRKS